MSQTPGPDAFGDFDDDSAQDPAQPAVGPAIQFEKLVVPMRGRISPWARRRRRVS